MFPLSWGCGYELKTTPNALLHERNFLRCFCLCAVGREMTRIKNFKTWKKCATKGCETSVFGYEREDEFCAFCYEQELKKEIGIMTQDFEVRTTELDQRGLELQKEFSIYQEIEKPKPKKDTNAARRDAPKIRITEPQKRGTRPLESKPIGHKINDIEIVEPPKPSPNGKRKAVFKCHCGKQFVGEYARWARGIMKSCGCSKGFRGERPLHPQTALIGTKKNDIEILGSPFWGKDRIKYARLLCHCGKEFDGRFSVWVHEKMQGCGCTRGKRISEALLKRGKK